MTKVLSLSEAAACVGASRNYQFITGLATSPVELVSAVLTVERPDGTAISELVEDVTLETLLQRTAAIEKAGCGVVCKHPRYPGGADMKNPSEMTNKFEQAELDRISMPKPTVCKSTRGGWLLLAVLLALAFGLGLLVGSLCH